MQKKNPNPFFVFIGLLMDRTESDQGEGQLSTHSFQIEIFLRFIGGLAQKQPFKWIQMFTRFMDIQAQYINAC